ncbi:MAG TPA: DNA topoisomerase IV subunit A [Micropepsaceae bacterium]|nr:DNA topoisomerase IV subunit A [Micropepsaceae bacterium]
MATRVKPPKDDEIRPESLTRALSERYLAYALSTIMHRALPDVRDGLKPVHRRLLYAMSELGLQPGSGFKKSARVVGDVIGKFHPHGDQAVYDALVRLAQDFSVRYPLIDGQGNFGNVDGDNPAAMRYTESRLTPAAGLLLDGIDENAVDFRPTYDGEEKEPVVFPSAFPNLLANGATGIAVGMATSIPPHNLAELCDALLDLNADPDITDRSLLKHIKGPDFPTGGIIVDDRETITAAYREGRGAFRLRARWRKEEGARGTWSIIVYEIPFQVQKAKLITSIAELITSKKTQLLDDVRDESAEDVRIVLEPKSRTVDPELLMEQLFRTTELESRISLNLNVLDAQQRPQVMSLKQALKAFLDHRYDVLVRRSSFRLERAQRRIEILDGYLAVYLNLDKVIRIIREEDEPKPKLMKAFRLSDVQADAILNMRLRNLRKLEEMEIRAEHAGLKKEAEELSALIKSKARQGKKIAEEIKAIGEQFGPKTPLGKRRTGFAEAPAVADVAPEAFIEREPITVICSQKGWIRAMKGHRDRSEEIAFKEGDRGRFFIHAETTDKLIAFGTNGKFYTLACDKLPGGRGMGEPIRLSIDLSNEEDLVALFVHKPDRKLLVASRTGHGFVVPENDVLAMKRGGKQVLNVAPGAEGEAALCVPAIGDHVAVIGENRKMVIFPLSDVPEMGRGRGVILQRFKDGGLEDARVFALAEGLPDANDRVWPKPELKDWMGARGQAGRLPPRGFPKSGRFNAR